MLVKVDLEELLSEYSDTRSTSCDSESQGISDDELEDHPSIKAYHALCDSAEVLTEIKVPAERQHCAMLLLYRKFKNDTPSHKEDPIIQKAAGSGATLTCSPMLGVVSTRTDVCRNGATPVLARLCYKPKAGPGEVSTSTPKVNPGVVSTPEAGPGEVLTVTTDCCMQT